MSDPRELPREQSIGPDVDEASFADWLVASVDIEKRAVDVDAPMTKRERRESRRTPRTSLDRVKHVQSFETSAASSRPLSSRISADAVVASERASRESIDSQKSRSMRSVKGSSGGFGWRMCFKRSTGTGESDSERSRDDEAACRRPTMDDEETPSPPTRSPNADLVLPVSLSTRASKTHPTQRVRHASLESIRGGPFRESEAAVDFPELRRLPIDDETFDTPTTPALETRDRRSEDQSL